ncbi:hypothetical protein ASD38_05290 [Caulobacter sp. Root487D2Y]|uniref:hypothetical protein n=1 Tax=Caulobacter sp. Root487D2Y TaxID=1736547 RepID=UPI0006F3D081|nr:hypothetical protein [Caulobacter sp. Root487D2Y]KQY35952.1 hypothetical protein ASD38_05290 [Caulobacter sp. Root487D2Y]
MTQITAVNSTDQSAQLAISKGGGGKTQALSGQISVAAEGVVIVPPVKTYTVHASAMLEGGAWFTNTLRLPGGGWGLTARIEKTGEVLSFVLVNAPIDDPDLITLASAVGEPTTFTITAQAADAPDQTVLSSQLVVQGEDRLAVGLADTYAFYAVVGGFTTDTVEADPDRPGQDVTVQIVAQPTDGGDAAYGLMLVEPVAKGA